MPSAASRSATRMAVCTYAPYEMIARSSPARRSAAVPIGIGAGRLVVSACLIRGIAVERDVLVVQDRIRIGDGGRHQRARVRRRRRDDDLQSGRAIEPGLRVLAVIRARVAQAAPRHAHDHRHGAAPPIADLRGVVHELIEAGRDEVVELHLADRPLPGERGADAHAEHRAFGERRIEDAVAELLRAAAAAAGRRCRSCRRRPRRRRNTRDRRASASPTPSMTASRNVRPLRSNGGPGSSGRQRRRRSRCARARLGSSTSTRTRGGSPANTPTPAVFRRRPRRVDDGARLRPRRAPRASRFQTRRARRRAITPSASSRAA